MSRWYLPAALLLLAVACLTSTEREESPLFAPAGELRAAVERTLPLLQASMYTWIQETECISCHHQGLGAMAVVTARERGFSVGEELLEPQVERAHWAGGALHGDAGINGTFGRGYQLLMLGAAGVPRDAVTDAVAHYVAGNATPADPSGEQSVWRSESFRPPLEASPVTGTAVALRALALYGPEARAADMARTIARGRRWLEEHEPGDAEERALRLLGLGWSGAAREVLDEAAEGILRAQRADGGWAQLPTMESDAYATGQALVALQQMAGVSVGAPAFRRGVRYLLDTQLDDGSWLVETRRRSPGLPYFESGFPHRMHQFISTAATAWATMALCCALDPSPAQAFHGPPPPRSEGGDTLGLEPVHLAAAFGSFEELRAALDAGADPNARDPRGLTPLHLAVHDPERVALLLERGAEVDARTTYGATPLILAAWYAGGEAAAELLLAAGADPNAQAEADGMTPFLHAVRGGKHELLFVLLDAGADLEAADVEGVSALHWATALGDVETAKLLLEEGAEVDRRCFDSTALHLASHDGEHALVCLLLEHGADVDATDEQGMTPLAWAAKVEHGDACVLEALLAAGSDATLACWNGRAPLDWARHFSNELAVAALAPGTEEIP